MDDITVPTAVLNLSQAILSKPILNLKKHRLLFPVFGWPLSHTPPPTLFFIKNFSVNEHSEI